MALHLEDFFPHEYYEDSETYYSLFVEMQKGAFSLAAKMKVPVVPITLIGTGKIMPVGMEGILNTGPVQVIIHKPIEGNDTETVRRESRNVIAEALNCQG